MTTIAAAYIDDRSRVENCLEKIGYSSKHLMSLLNDVLDMSKITEGKMKVTYETFALESVVESISSIIYPQSVEKHLDFTVPLVELTETVLAGDSMRLNQVLLDFCPMRLNESGRARLEIRQVQRSGNQVRLRFTVSELLSSPLGEDNPNYCHNGRCSPLKHRIFIIWRNKMLKKLKPGILCAIILALCLVSAFFYWRNSSGEKGRRLTFASWYTEDEALAYRDIAARYHELYPEVTIDFITLDYPERSFAAYGENIVQPIEEKKIDLVLLHPSMMTMIEENGWVGKYLADIHDTPLFQQYSSAMRQMVTMTDKSAYGYPSFMSFVGMVSNTDLLAECGVKEIPRTYTAWVNSMEKVREAGYIPFASYAGDDSSSMVLTGAMAYAEVLYGNTPKDANAADVFLPAITRLSGLMEAGLLENSENELIGGKNRDVVTKAFPKGNVAYIICPSWYLPKLREAAPDFSYKMTAIPASDSGSIVDVRAGWPVGIAVNGQQDEAVRFLSFAMLPENMALLADSKGNVSPLKNNTDSDVFYKDILRSVQEGAVYSDGSNKYGFNIAVVLDEAASGLLQGKPLSEVQTDLEENITEKE